MPRRRQHAKHSGHSSPLATGIAPKAVERLADDWERLVTFYQFPREHWPHLRTSNVVESPFATVRLRTTAAKRFKRVENATALIWKMLQVAESTFRRLKGAELLPSVYAGAQYVDSVRQPQKLDSRWPPNSGGKRVSLYGVAKGVIESFYGEISLQTGLRLTAVRTCGLEQIQEAG